MFCPVCKLEYRTGFTRCNDCDVPLVASLDDAQVHTNAPQDPDAVEILWTGTNSGVSGAIAAALDSANVAYHERVRDVGPLPGLAQPVYAILIHGRDHNAAQTVLENVRRQLGVPQTDSDSSGSDLLSDVAEHNASSDGQLDDLEESDEPTPDDIIEDFDPDEAIEGVWSGSDMDTRNMLIACLRENGIGCALDDSGAEHRICVMPRSEKRAKEIIREVVEASAPPE